MSINRWMDKESMVHIYTGILLIYKKEWNCAICRDVDGPRDCQSKVRKRKTNTVSVQFSSVQLLSHVQLFATPWTAACQASLSIANSQNLLKLMSIESVMPFNHLILCHPLLLLPSIFPSIRVFSDESALCIRWPKYWSFSFSISPSNEYSGLISFSDDYFKLEKNAHFSSWVGIWLR